jgi:glycosyltransferase involved in cell wall biosynthesis
VSDRDQQPAVVLAANYGSNVGYAWNNIYRLFSALMHAFEENGIRSCVTFKEMDGPVNVFDPGLKFETFQFDWRDVTVGTALQLRRYVKKYNIRHVYLTDQLPTRFQYALLRAAGIRRIVVHSRISVPNPQPAPPARGVRRLIKTIVSRLPWISADRVYAVSDFVRNRIIQVNCYPPQRVLTILNGIEVDRWISQPPAMDANPVTFYSGARANRYKGILVLLEAAAKLKKQHGVENFRVRYAGDGPDIDLFRKFVEDNGLVAHVQFLGKLRDTRDEVCSADVIVVPSAYGDACPSTVSEALASGRPLITTRAGGIPELVGDPGNAIVIPPGDAAALAEAMAMLVRNPDKRRELGSRGRMRAQSALRQDVYHKTVVRQLLADLGIAPASMQKGVSSSSIGDI